LDKTAKIESYWSRFVAAMDCEYKFTKCAGELFPDWFY
jgi:hypothetical protein